ncbi:hypothetical protein GGH99_002211 [Coemansia sp. RSA 1285]|nr:hypothetical protein GGH99_002211 [Coemansia sp. RSA 1285]
MFSNRPDHRAVIESTASAPNSAPAGQQQFSQHKTMGMLSSLAVGVAETVRTIQDVIHSPHPRIQQHRGYAGKDAAASARHATDEDNDLAATDSEKSARKQTNSILEKYHGELYDVAEKCKVLSQFAEQYGPEHNRFNAQPSDDLVIDMARKAYEVLMVFMTIRRERMSTSVDDDTMEYIRKRRTVLSPARTKSRKRSVSINLFA